MIDPNKLTEYKDVDLEIRVHEIEVKLKEIPPTHQRHQQLGREMMHLTFELDQRIARGEEIR